MAVFQCPFELADHPITIARNARKPPLSCEVGVALGPHNFRQSSVVLRPAGEAHADSFGQTEARCFKIEIPSAWDSVSLVGAAWAASFGRIGFRLSEEHSFSGPPEQNPL